MAHYQYKQEEDVEYASCKRKVVKLLKPTNEATDGVGYVWSVRAVRQAKHSHEPDKLPSDSRLQDSRTPQLLLLLHPDQQTNLAFVSLLSVTYGAQKLAKQIKTNAHSR